MIDWHSHILPGMDDGSKDVEESLAMLAQLAAQGVKTVIATPHFYANDETVEAFLNRRQQAWMRLKARLPKDAPEILLGAEVRYYRGISRMDDIRKLCIRGSHLLLLEMPMAVWSDSILRELTELSGKGDLQILLAHVDRYLNIQKPDTWHHILQSDILMQINASAFTGMLPNRKALALLKAGVVPLVGSDCHNMTSRSPRLGKAAEAIRKKLGDECLNQINQYGNSLFTATKNK